MTSACSVSSGNGAAATVAAEYPETQFAVVDGYVTFVGGDMKEIPNATDINFAERGLPTNLAPSRDIGLQVGGEAGGP